MKNKNAVFSFLHNKRKGTLQIRFRGNHPPNTPPTTGYNVTITLDGEPIVAAPPQQNVAPDTNGWCALTPLNIANEVPGVYDVEAIPVRNGQPVANDAINGEFNTVNPFLRRSAFITYVVLALLLLVGFGIYKWMTWDTNNSNRKTAKNAISDSASGQQNRSHDYKDPGESEDSPDEYDNAGGGKYNGGRFSKTDQGYIVAPIYIPARTQFFRIKLRDNNPGKAEPDAPPFRDTAQTGAPEKSQTYTLRRSAPRTPQQQPAEIIIHTVEEPGITLDPGASYTQALPSDRTFEPSWSVPGAIRVSHSGGQRIDSIETSCATTVTLKNVSDKRVDVKFTWFDVIENTPPGK